MARAILLAILCMQAVGAANVFFAKMQPLESDGPVGWVAVAVTPTGLVVAGGARGLEPRLHAAPRGANCTATNGCGTHVHSGTACTDTTTQGGHYFAPNVTDPWASVGYTFTTREGFSLFKFSIKTTAQEILQKPFIIHNNAGGRVACGLLDVIVPGKLPKYAANLLHMKNMPAIEELEDDEDDVYDGLDDEDEEDDNAEEDDDDEDDEEDAAGAGNVFFAKMQPLESDGPAGWVAIAVTPSGLVGAGVVNGLEPKLRAAPHGANCTATNGCGTHVHSGRACTDTTTQGGHYFAPNVTDPWSSVGYTFSTRRGSSFFQFSIETTAQDILQKPFIIHNNAGGRIACGLLDSIAPGKLPKYAAHLLHMKKMPTIEELEREEDNDDGDDEEDDDDEDEDDDNAEDDDERRRLSATTILI